MKGGGVNSEETSCPPPPPADPPPPPPPRWLDEVERGDGNDTVVLMLLVLLP